MVIDLYESHSNTIRDNTFTDCLEGAATFGRSWNNEFVHNRVTSGLLSGPLISGQSGNTLVADNTFGAPWGLTVMYSDNTTITRNTFSRNALSGGADTQVTVAYASGTVVTDNTVADVTDISGHEGGLACIELQHATDSTVANNRIGSLRAGDRSEVGILLWGASSDNRILGNEIGDARRGISLHYASNGNTVAYNTFHPATEQPVVVELSDDNVIHHNNFLGGARAPFDDTGTNRWDDGEAGNYWADYGGNGAVPYAVPPLGSDAHPLLAQVPLRHEAVTPNPPLPIQLRDAPRLDVSTDLEISDQTVGPYRWVEIRPGGRLTLRNATLLMVGDGRGIFVQGGGALEAYDSRIVPPSPERGGFYFWVYPGAALVLERSEVRGLGAGLGCGDWASLYIEASGAVIEDSTFTDCLCAVNARAGGGHRINRNTIGLCLNCSNGASDSTLEGNRVDRCLNLGLQGGDRVEIRGNSVSHVWGRAIVTNEDSVVVGNSMADSDSGLQVSTGSTVSDNVITGMFGWAFVNYCAGCLIQGNTFAESGGGVQGYGLSTYCGNNFIRNAVQAQAVGGANHWDCDRRGNYWSDYQGVDANGDGLGDTPYPILGGERDNFPLMDKVRRPPRRHLTRSP